MTTIYTINPETLLPEGEEPRPLHTPASQEPLIVKREEPEPVEESRVHPKVPSARAQSWGAVVSIVVIVMMIVIGAFYTWGKRIAENQQFLDAANQNQQGASQTSN